MQKTIASHLDLSQQAVSQMLADLRIDWKSATLAQVRVAYIRRLREQAAGRATIGDLDLAGERARLAKEQADRVAMQNAVTRGELAPVALLEQVLAAAAGKVAGIFDAIPGLVRRRVPHLTREDLDLIAAEIAKARNTVAAMSLTDLQSDESADAWTAPPAPVVDDGHQDGDR
ncbi:MAG: terminase small subunit [Sulfuritalea sp.]|nr:terminase small subunit [Sulfuritalea sp.]